MAQSMTEALKIPHFGYCDEVDMSALVELRSQLKDSPLLGNIKFSYMPVILKVSVTIAYPSLTQLSGYLV